MDTGKKTWPMEDAKVAIEVEQITFGL